MDKRLAKKPTVLVVDDEPGVRQLLSRVLERAGFEVLLASDGLEAMRLYLEVHQRIALVLLDVSMPGQDGVHALKALQEIDPDRCCCLMTGYSEGYRTHDLTRCGAAAVFPKPLNLIGMVKTLRSLTDTSSHDLGHP